MGGGGCGVRGGGFNVMLFFLRERERSYPRGIIMFVFILFLVYSVMCSTSLNN